MEAFASIKTVASITAICFLVGLFCKTRKWDTWIPCIVGTAGGLLGVAGLFVIPGFPAGNVLDAIAVGIASGLAATGAHQIYKQLTQDEDKGHITFLAYENYDENGDPVTTNSAGGVADDPD